MICDLIQSPAVTLDRVFGIGKNRQEKIRGNAVGATVSTPSAELLKNGSDHSFPKDTPVEKLGLKDAVAKIREFL